MDEGGVRALINAVVDPCSAGRGVPIGLTDMGLVRAVRMAERDGRAGVEVDMRVTSPGCMFAAEFDAQIRAKLSGAGAAWVDVDWENSEFDWTEDDIHPAARARLQQYKGRVTAAAGGSSGPTPLTLHTSPVREATR